MSDRKKEIRDFFPAQKKSFSNRRNTSQIFISLDLATHFNIKELHEVGYIYGI